MAYKYEVFVSYLNSYQKNLLAQEILIIKQDYLMKVNM